MADAILYPLWDLKLAVGHAVRAPAESLALARHDYKSCTALLELAVIAGLPTAAKRLEADTKSFVASRRVAFLDENRRAYDERHARFGDTPFLLEPDVKQSPGGLRDVQTAHWAALAQFGSRDFRALATNGVVSLDEANRLAEAEEFLLALRGEIHRTLARKEDHFTYEVQDAVAPRLKYSDGAGRGESAAERCLRDYHRVARDVAQLTREILGRIDAVVHSGSGRSRKASRTPFCDEVVTESGGVLAARKRPLSPDDAVGVVEAAARSGLPLEAATRVEIHRLMESAPPSAGARAAFLERLVDVDDDVHVLRHLLDAGVLSWVVPEFRAVECRVQRDLYHLFTVDVHSLFAVDRLKEVFRGAWIDREPFLSGLAQEVSHRAPLFLGVLLHDVGKGYGSGHSERGAEIATNVGERLGLSRDECRHLSFLVREHLMLMRATQHRDLEDADVIGDIAARVGSRARLVDLALLSFVDSSTTAPNVWTPWKSALLSELVERVAGLLAVAGESTPDAGSRVAAPDARRKGESSPSDSSRADRSADSPFLAEISPTLVDGVVEATFRCADRPGRLALIAGAMATAGIDVLSARILTSADEIVDQIHARMPSHTPVAEAWKRAVSTLKDLFEGRLSVDACASLVAPMSRSIERRGPRVETRVDVHNLASQRFSVVEVRCRDRRGLLFVLARALTDAGVTIALAKISTDGGRASDAFYVTTVDGSKVPDPAQFADDLRKRIDAFVNGSV
ncbi:MAG: ACT domain-containing protein [Deltaproteobacteria bacterium]|nr:ACT domain-containing protein [Deltaproteobacteria bacterium]